MRILVHFLLKHVVMVSQSSFSTTPMTMDLWTLVRLVCLILFCITGIEAKTATASPGRSVARNHDGAYGGAPQYVPIKHTTDGRTGSSAPPPRKQERSTTTMPAREELIRGLASVELIPDVIPEPFEPSVWFDVVYPAKPAELGSFMTVEDTQAEPDIILSPFNENSVVDKSKTYTFVMTDPDAPSRAEPIYRQFRHWVITGIKFPENADDSTPAIKTKPSTTPYRPPGPRPGSGLHRYTFILFEEPDDGFVVPEGSPEYGSALEERRSWNAVDFAKKYNLSLVGASFFRVMSE